MRRLKIFFVISLKKFGWKSHYLEVLHVKVFKAAPAKKKIKVIQQLQF